MKLSIFWMLLEAAGAFHAPASPRKNRRLAHQASQVRGVARPARLYDENSENANFLETLALFRRIGAAATLDALLEGLKTRSVDFGRRDDIQWDHEEYRSTDGVKALYDAAHVDPFSFRSDFFRSLAPRDVARLNDFWVALRSEPYCKLLTGASDPTTVSELRDGEDRYVRRVKIDDVLYTFSLAKRGDKWGVEWILSEPDSE